jgi:hypothetical protein
LGIAFAFFLEESELGKEVEQLLFQVRESKGPTCNIALCALLESLVNAVFEDRCLNGHSNLVSEFSAVRGECLGMLDARLAAEVGNRKKTLARLRRILENANYWSTREKFRAVAENLGLSWEGDWENLYQFWAANRGGLVHRGSRKRDEDDVSTGFQVQSRAAGAINMIILKLMGYKGIVNSSVFEDQFKRI